jgi:hypothetical protein
MLVESPVYIFPVKRRRQFAHETGAQHSFSIADATFDAQISS